MVSRSNFFVKQHPKIKNEDLPNLPEKLQELYSVIIQILSVDPYRLSGKFRYHELTRELSGWRSIDSIQYLGVSYRLVYRIDDSPKNMRVDIASFDIHDSAYDKANQRAYRERF
jgi:mRNA interferase RelE/StbE